MAPERFLGDISEDNDSLLIIKAPSELSDVYSLTMTSVNVRPSIVSHPTTQYDRPVTTRSSRGYCHMITVIRLM